MVKPWINYPIYNRKKEIIIHTKIDKEDLKKINEFSWAKNGRHYIKGRIDNKDIYLHRFVMKEYDPKILIDHINNDPMDNRKSNLRRVTIQENCFNRTKMKNASSKYKGVSYNKASKKWACYIKLNQVKYNLGFYDTEKEAALTYNKFAKIMFSEHSKLNKISR